jgi:hypothetical protein
MRFAYVFTGKKFGFSPMNLLIKLEKWGESYEVDFPRGATHVLDFAQQFIKKLCGVILYK